MFPDITPCYAHTHTYKMKEELKHSHLIVLLQLITNMLTIFKPVFYPLLVLIMFLASAESQRNDKQPNTFTTRQFQLTA